MPVIIFSAFLLALAVPVLVYGLLPKRATAHPSRMAAPLGPGARIGSAAAAAAATDADADPLRRFVPKRTVASIERNLALAGMTAAWPIHRVLRTKLIAGATAVLFGVILVLPDPSPLRALIAAAIVFFATFIPDLVVSARAQSRQDQIRLELADALDEITISIEAGLSLETALARAGQYGKGPLAQELTRTVQDMRVGFSRKEAYTALAERTSVTDLRRLARAIMQADQYWVSVGTVVRTQAKELRMKRRQRAEEKAMKVPVKVLFPLMFCILPVLFVVVLGPAVINLTKVFGLLPGH